MLVSVQHELATIQKMPSLQCRSSSLVLGGLNAKFKLLHPSETHATSSPFRCSLLLQQLRYFQLDIEELGCTAIEAYALPLIDLSLAVFSGHALLHASLLESKGVH